MLSKFNQTTSNPSFILIRIMLGVVFLSEGIQKFLYPAIRGAGRFEKIGLPYPEFLGSFVGTSEIICGVLLLLGLFTRLSSLVTTIIMITAILTTKFIILNNDGFWSMMHASRTDWAMLLGSIFLLINGGGKWSLDIIYQNRQKKPLMVSKEMK
ncbi:DoxX family protein [Flammeovirga sp. EKP202]|uniref:DoxX family protein n=1 Tax=Flammeovirga sp. EKP202 TaxID=2770592 RepID=UPI00165F568E|nr:DoxX family protein [Flammeovirga sp. EKP202]MBD0403948.1 DoxX family protein [Flammeovirga sp. EKP202]